MADSRFTHVNWPSLLKRLIACALKWFIQEGCFEEDAMLPCTGQSAQDLAYGAVLEVLRDEKVHWRPKTEDEDPFPLIARVMRNDFLDLMKQGREYKRSQIVDADKSLNDVADPVDGFCNAEAAALAKKLYPLVEGNPDLKDYIDAVLVLGLEKREDIASVLGVSPQEVTNRKRRLQTVLADWRLSMTTKVEEGSQVYE